MLREFSIKIDRPDIIPGAISIRMSIITDKDKVGCERLLHVSDLLNKGAIDYFIDCFKDEFKKYFDE